MNFKLDKIINFFKSYVFSSIILAISYIFNLVSQYRFEPTMTNSDMASELILANLLNSEHKFISTNWIYSTELRVFCTQIIYKLALFIFPHNWRLARTFSVAIFLAIFIFAIIFLFKAFDQFKAGIWACVICLCPLCSWYVWDILYFSHYILFTSISFILLGLLIHMHKSCTVKAFGISACIYCILCFLSGLNGVRQLLICIVPIALTYIIYLYIVSPKFSNKFKVLGIEILGLVLSLAGLWINENVFSKIYHFRHYNKIEWAEFSLNRIIKCLGDFIGLFGYRKEVLFFSASGIANAAGLVLIIGLFVAIIWLFKHIKNLSEGELLVLLFTTVTFLFDLLVYSFIDSYNQSYWVMHVPFFLVTIIIFIKNIMDTYRKSFIGFYVVVSMLLCSISTLQSPYIATDSTTIQGASNWLNQSGYTQGFGMFWESNVLTQLSNGEIEMWTVTDLISVTPYEWLQLLSHIDNLPEGPVFLIVAKNDVTNEVIPGDALSPNLAYGDDYFYIYTFNDISEYIAIVQN
ncbi:MAG: hypothetical protein K6A23_04570 [Butyrivibrio sp.]|nr:hypothetical protein [Butyrivibrio sp.]